MSKKPILVVESPSKARTISKYLDGDFEVLACVGHVKDLPKNKLNIDVHNNFKATLEVLPDRKQFIQELKSKAKTASKVILAMDPDREGEAIADHITQEIPQATIERIQFLEITKTAVKNALGQPRPLNTNLISAQMTRRIIDRLVGYSISPVLWGTLQKNMKFVKTALSAGRVQSAAVKIMVDRERKRARFKQANYFDLKAVLKTANSENFESNLFKLNDQNLATGKDFERETGQLKNQEVLLLTESQANALLEELKPGPWVVSDIKEKPRTSKPYPPFTTSTLQQEAGRKLRYTAKNTMRIAQRLYEAGFITYMRTDSTHLSGEALNAARSDIDRLYGKEYLPAKPIQYATKVKNAQEAHEAIRPAGRVFTSMDTVSGALGDDASKLYDLIWKRTMASQMMPARMKQTMLFISNQNALFRSRGNVILFPGYMRAYVEGKDDPRAKLADKETILPEVNVNDKIHCDDLSAVEHNTKPPARYTEASLVKALEAKGIGRPSTYASIIDTIIFREYVKNVKGALIPTFLSVAVTQLLENHFASLVNTEFTSRMEDSLDAIARGELDAFPFMKSFYFGNEKTIGLEKMLEAEIDIRKACAIDNWPEDENTVHARIGLYGPYLQKGEKTKTIPFSVALGDLTLEKAQELLEEADKADAPLGTDPENGDPVYLKDGKYGLYVQLGDSKTRKSIPKSMLSDPIDLNVALQLLSLPKTLGNHPETGEPVTADFGRYGPYIKSGKTNAKLFPPLSPLTVKLGEALSLLAKRKKGSVELKIVGTHPETGEALILKDGRYGPYVTDGKVNASIPKESNPDTLSLEEATELINKRRAAPPKKRRRKKSK